MRNSQNKICFVFFKEKFINVFLSGGEGGKNYIIDKNVYIVKIKLLGKFVPFLVFENGLQKIAKPNISKILCVILGMLIYKFILKTKTQHFIIKFKFFQNYNSQKCVGLLKNN